jgi:hypothetical protein
MNAYRFLIALVILLPYMLMYRFNQKETPFWLDIMVATVAFGLGHILFPDKRGVNHPPKKEDKNVIDQD